MKDQEIVVVSAVRTPFSRFGGVLRDVPSILLGAWAIREAVARAGLKNDEIDEVYYGTCQPAETCLENDVPDRQAVLEAARRCAVSDGVDEERFASAMAEAIHSSADGAPDVDLLIRTGGEQRLSDFLLWECAYAELVFTPGMWPDFSAEDLEAALCEFRRRDRRFGAVAAAV